MIVTSYVRFSKKEGGKKERTPQTSMYSSLSRLSQVRKEGKLLFVLSYILVNQFSGYGNIGCGKLLSGRPSILKGA